MARKTTTKPRKTQGKATSEPLGVTELEAIQLLIEDSMSHEDRLDRLEEIVAALVVRVAVSGMQHGNN